MIIKKKKRDAIIIKKKKSEFKYARKLRRSLQGKFKYKKEKWKIKYDRKKIHEVSNRMRTGEVIRIKWKINRNLTSGDDVSAIKRKKAKSKKVEDDEAKIRSDDRKVKKANFWTKIDIARKKGKTKFFRKYSGFKYKGKVNYSALSERKECVEEQNYKVSLTTILGTERDRPLKWRVRKKLGTEIKGRVDRNQIVKRNPKEKSHLGKTGNYDRNQWFKDKAKIYLRKNVKKKLGNYDLGFPRRSIQKNGRFKTKGSFAQYNSVHYTKERSVLEHMNLGMNLGKY